MAISGTGVVPTGSVFNELSAVTRRAFIPKLFVQMYFASPSLFYLWGNAQRAAGGLNQITIPLQGNSMTQGQFVGYGGGFNSPVITPGIQNAQFNLAYWVVPIPLPFGETIIQATDREISLLKARMNDAYAVTRQQVASLLFTNNSANPLYPNSFYDAFDSGTNVSSYGGINRNAAGNANFKGQLINMSTAFSGYSVSTLGFTRQSMAALLNYVTDQAGGESPTFVVMAPTDFATLNANIQGVEQVFITPGKEFTMDTPVRSSFPNLNISGIPVFQDHFCPAGHVYGVNCKYSAMYLSEDAAMDFSGFYSLVPLGQIGQQGVVVLGYDFVSAKSVSGFHAYNVGGGSW